MVKDTRWGGVAMYDNVDDQILDIALEYRRLGMTFPKALTRLTKVLMANMVTDSSVRAEVAVKAAFGR